MIIDDPMLFQFGTFQLFHLMCLLDWSRLESFDQTILFVSFKPSS